MKGCRFISDDDTSRYCNPLTEALSNGWKLHWIEKMRFDKKKEVIQWDQLVTKTSPKKNSKKVFLVQFNF